MPLRVGASIPLLTAARAVVAVEQDDLVDLAPANLVGMAQPDHVLGVLVEHPGLAHHEGNHSRYLAETYPNLTSDRTGKNRRDMAACGIS